jgi:holo-[acyl-carrier protein] synthase
MISGTGIDVVDIERIDHVISKWTDKFLDRIFTQGEIDYCRSRVNATQHFAARFAAKEAFAKAIATGWAEAFHWQHIEVENEFSGRPCIVLHGSLKERFGNARIHLSMSHTHATAVAMVVIEE